MHLIDTIAYMISNGRAFNVSQAKCDTRERGAQ